MYKYVIHEMVLVFSPAFFYYYYLAYFTNDNPSVTLQTNTHSSLIPDFFTNKVKTTA